jgi:dihydrofolate reductase
MVTSLVALVGADANIGSEGDLPVFADNDERIRQLHWFDALSVGSIIVMGSNTIRLMQSQGFRGVDDQRTLVPWSRDHGQTPEAFLAELQREGRHIIIAGGATTFRLFAPFCENYYLRRVTLLNPPDFRLDPILPSWQSRRIDAGSQRVPRLS